MNELDYIKNKIASISYQIGLLKTNPIVYKDEINKLNKKLSRYRLRYSQLKSKEVKNETDNMGKASRL